MTLATKRFRTGCWLRFAGRLSLLIPLNPRTDASKVPLRRLPASCVKIHVFGFFNHGEQVLLVGKVLVEVLLGSC